MRGCIWCCEARAVIARSTCDEAIHSCLWPYGLLRGACHRAALCADPLARNDGDGGELRYSRGAITPELCIVSGPPENRGRRECRVKASPMAPVRTKKHGEGTTGSSESSGIPCAM